MLFITSRILLLKGECHEIPTISANYFRSYHICMDLVLLVHTKIKRATMHQFPFRQFLMLLLYKYGIYSCSNHLIPLHSFAPTILSNWKKSKSPSPFTQRKLQLNVESRNNCSSNLQPSPPVMTIHFHLSGIL